MLFRRKPCNTALTAKYARLSALCPAGIRAFAPVYVFACFAVFTHTPVEMHNIQVARCLSNILLTES